MFITKPLGILVFVIPRHGRCYASCVCDLHVFYGFLTFTSSYHERIRIEPQIASISLYPKLIGPITQFSSTCASDTSKAMNMNLELHCIHL